MKRGILIGFLILTMAALILSAIAHFATFFGIDPQAKFPAVWLLHLGIFIVILPLLIVYGKEPGGRFGTIDHTLVMKYVPSWMKSLLMILSIYTAVNFGLFFVLSEAGAPDVWEGKYVLQNKGTFIRELSKAEYEKHLMYEVRGFSGHWLIFYFYPLIAYYSYLKKQEEEEEEDEETVELTD